MAVFVSIKEERNLNMPVKECSICDEIAVDYCFECNKILCVHCRRLHRSLRHYVIHLKNRAVQLIRPWGVCTNNQGQVLVTETTKNKAYVVDLNYGYLFSIGKTGQSDGKFNFPAGICVDNDKGRIIVVDHYNHRVQIFNSRGEFLLKFGSYGKAYGQFEYPRHVAVDTRGRIVVADSLNHRIQQFDSEGRFMRYFTFDGLRRGIAIPSGVCYTPNGNIIVSDIGNHCLYLIDPDENKILFCRGYKGSSRQAFNYPACVICDDNGRVLVADSRNQRLILCCSETINCLEIIETRPSLNPIMAELGVGENDRISIMTWTPSGKIAFLGESPPDSEHTSSSYRSIV